MVVGFGVRLRELQALTQRHGFAVFARFVRAAENH
jgi:hypothetical protein